MLCVDENKFIHSYTDLYSDTPVGGQNPLNYQININPQNLTNDLTHHF